MSQNSLLVAIAPMALCLLVIVAWAAAAASPAAGETIRQVGAQSADRSIEFNAGNIARWLLAAATLTIAGGVLLLSERRRSRNQL